ncbi:MAG: metallophosphoesterase [Candidatus Njordarchaeia archaeon]
MRFLALGNIHGDFDRFVSLFDLVLSELDFDYVFFTGNFGSFGVFKRVVSYVSSCGFRSVSVYGSDDNFYFKRLLKSGEIHVGNGVLLPLGGLFRVGGFKILGVGGLKGHGRNWFEWRDQTILKIIDYYQGKRVDVVLAYDFPQFPSGECWGNDVCGRYVLRKLVEEVEPRVYIGGRVHGAPRFENFDSVVVLQSGSVSNFDDSFSYVTLFDTRNSSPHFYRVAVEGKTLSKL